MNMLAKTPYKPKFIRFFLVCLSLTALTGCASSAMVKAEAVISGIPADEFEGNSTVIMKFMQPTEISSYCGDRITSKNILPSWYHACVYQKNNGEIIMVAPPPGSMESSAYVKLLTHEYQHVGQALRGDKLDHEGWN